MTADELQQNVSTMHSVYLSLLNEHRSASVYVGGTYAMTQSAKDAALTALDLALRIMDTLKAGGWRYNGVLDGSYTMSKWATQAQFAHDFIADARGSTRYWAMTEVLASAVNQSVDDFKQGVADLEAGVFPWAILVVVGLVALLLLRLLG